MQDAIREATVNAILERSEKLELAFHVEKALSESGEGAAHDVISQMTKAFISESDKHRELAHRVAEATKQIREESPKKLLDAVKKKLEQEINQRERIPNNWEICDGYTTKEPGKDLHVLLRKCAWPQDPAKGEYQFPGVQVFLGKHTTFGVKLPIQNEYSAEQRRDILNTGGIGKCIPCTFWDWGDEPTRSMLWRLAPPLADWRHSDFMKAVRSDSDRDEIACKLADELVCLVRLVDEHLELAQANQDDG